ncbi:MAG: glycosyltransferase family 4 protein [Candidatus Hadarchaeales archaeon]
MEKMNLGVIVPDKFNPPLLSLLKYLKRKVTPILITYGERRLSSSPNFYYVEEFLQKEHIKREYIATIKFKQDIPLLLRKYDLDIAIGGEFFWLSNVVFRLLTTNNFYSYTFENIPTVLRNLRKFFLLTSNILYKKIIFPVPSTKEVWIKEGIREEKTAIIPYGVDTELFKPSRNKLEDKLKIIFIGRICEAKGLDYLFDALRLIKKTIPTSLTIIGSGEVDRYRILALKMGITDSVNFLGPVRYDMLPKYLEQNNVLVLPSVTTKNWKEQYGMVLIEAMATGRVVIGSDSGAIPDVINGAGIVVREKQSDDIADALMKLWNNPDYLKFYSEKGINKVREKYAAGRVAKKYFDLFNV